VDHWNAWFDSLIYINDQSLHVVQIFIRQLVIEQNSNVSSSIASFNTRDTMSTVETQRAAAVLLAMVPILCVYPFIQRYFVKGVMVGSLKG
jgi:putative aldouronate transport system permease protein